MSSGNDYRRLEEHLDGVERTPRPAAAEAGGIPVPEREEVLTAPEGTLAPHVTAEAVRRLEYLEPEDHIERGTE